MNHKDSRQEILGNIRNSLSGMRHFRYSEGSQTALSDNIRRDFLTKDETGKRKKKSGDILFSTFKEMLTSLSGGCEYVKSEEDILPLIIDIFEHTKSKSFVSWGSGFLDELGLNQTLKEKNYKYIKSRDKKSISRADIGITEADYGIADSGTLVLLTDEIQYRSASLVPPVHIAILNINSFVNDIFALFSLLNENMGGLNEINDISSCITFITGPSRTADIELNLTLGVHGPKEIYVIVHDS